MIHVKIIDEDIVKLIDAAHLWKYITMFWSSFHKVKYRYTTQTVLCGP